MASIRDIPAFLGRVPRTLARSAAARRRIVVSIVLAPAIAALTLSFLAPKHYHSSVTLIVHDRRLASLPTQQAIIKSHVVLSRTALLLEHSDLPAAVNWADARRRYENNKAYDNRAALSRALKALDEEIAKLGSDPQPGAKFNRCIETLRLSTGLETAPDAVPSDVLIVHAVQPGSPERACAAADLLARSYLDQLWALQGDSIDAAADSPGVVILEPPHVADARLAYPRPALYTVMALIAGVIIAAGYALLADYREGRLQDAEDVETCIGLPVVGSVSHCAGGLVN